MNNNDLDSGSVDSVKTQYSLVIFESIASFRSFPEWHHRLTDKTDSSFLFAVHFERWARIYKGFCIQNIWS